MRRPRSTFSPPPPLDGEPWIELPDEELRLELLDEELRLEPLDELL